MPNQSVPNEMVTEYQQHRLACRCRGITTCVALPTPRANRRRAEIRPLQFDRKPAAARGNSGFARRGRAYLRHHRVTGADLLINGAMVDVSGVLPGLCHQDANAPFHTWLPDAHAEAPTAGSVILAGVLLKMGGYGFLRFCLPMFLAVGQLYDRTHSRMIQDYGGLHKQMPRFVALFFLFSVASFGLPGTCSFIGEFLVLLGASEVSFVMVLLAMGGIVLAASYMLWMLQRVALGQPATRTASLLPDLTVREMVTLVPLAMIVLWIGVYPAPMLEMINASVANLVPATK